jgi:hypothetical protein
MFCAPSVLGTVYMFCAPGLIFDSTEGVRSCFHVLRSRTCFRRHRGRWVPFSSFALPDSFSTVPRASGPVFMFCAPGRIFGGNKGVGSRFHVLRSRAHFLRYQELRIPFSSFALSDSFLAVPRASGPVFMFCVPGLIFGGTDGVGFRFHFFSPGLIFGGTKGVGSCFHVLRAQTRFRRYRERQVPFSCFALLDMFLAVPCASGHVVMFCAPRLVFDGPEGDGSLFHVLRAGTSVRRYRGRRVPFSCFALPDTFSVERMASDPVLFFCVPGLVFGDTKGAGSRFHILRSRSRFPRYRGRQVPFSYFVLPHSFSAVPRASAPFFMFCAPRLVFDDTEGVGSRFHVLRSQTCFSAVPSASGHVFMFCASGLVFGGLEGDGSLFHVLRGETSFRRYRGRRVPFSCFALPDTFSAERMASDLVFFFCVFGLIFGGTEGAESRFHVLRSRNCFPRYRGRRVQFLSFALPDSFSAVPRASGPVLMFCTHGLIFGGTKGVGSHFLVLRSLTRFRRF